MTRLIATTLSLLLVQAAATAGAAEVIAKLPEQVSFNAHIRPIMSNTCFTCHGPDDSANDSGYRIDTFAAATAALPSDDEMVGIQPGDPAASEVYRRIVGEGDGEQMPPYDFLHQLTDYEKALFKLWIEQGAIYEQHWSYAPLARPPVPELGEGNKEGSNAVDAFILARLEREGIAPSPVADKATLLRRLSLDLTGLPPTLEELNAFAEDASPDAYQKQVERLLRSPHFGERMATPWLDLVRFADTVGFHGDQNQRIFPYRDYVIDSFNKNKRFDQFTLEQIAGDLLPDATDEQLTATGFLRLNMMTREGGAQPEEYLAKYKADRVRAIGTAWLGATLACCECHNHKYDPFTSRDFYSLGAFFDDLRQWGVYANYGYTPNPDLTGFNNDYPFPPELRVDSQSLRQEIKALGLERDHKLFATRQVHSDDIDSPLQSWTREVNEVLREYPEGWVPARAVQATASRDSAAELMEDGSVLLTGQPQKSEVVTISARVEKTILANSIRVEVLPHERNGGQVGRGEDGRFSTDFSAAIDHNPDASQPPQLVPTRPRFIRIELPGDKRILSLAEVEAFALNHDGREINMAKGKKASQSSTSNNRAASRAVDGNTDGDLNQAQSTTHTETESNPWWEVDLGADRKLDKIVIWNRTDGQLQKRLAGLQVSLLNEDRRPLQVLTPDLPQPSIELSIPTESTLQSIGPVPIGWAEANRQMPQSYKGGAEPLTLVGKWYSGPSRWQLPADESRLPHTAVYHFAKPIELSPDVALIVKLASGDIGQVRLAVTPVGHAIAGWPAADQGLRKALGKPAEKRTLLQQMIAFGAFHRSTIPIADQDATSRFYRDQILQLRTGLAMTLVAQSVDEELIPVSRVLPRGNWQDRSGDLAPPATPRFLPPADAAGERPPTRLDLARWLTSNENPLTPRHFVNRTWKQFFGTGLSSKLDDLGNQGEWPSHPLLLDWLASEFVESGWDMKHVIRLIVNSRTYRQRAAARADLVESDPYNRLLAQQSARRLEAEAIRDHLLAIAGLLEAEYIGGPSVFPYQPEGHYRNLQFPNRVYSPSNDFRQYRRGIYMHWQRTFLHPMLVNFDAPSRDECTADRSQSNSPQQALTLLNDPSFAEAAHVMASQLISSDADGEFDLWLTTAFLKAVARAPSRAERTTLRKLFSRQQEYFSANHAEAEQFLELGNAQIDTASDPATCAALAQVCRVILNLHETITRY